MATFRDQLIRETFELSREIGFHKFLADNFNRADPVLMELGPEERKVFLRDWWDGARDRMFESYREQVAGLSVLVLLDRREDYFNTLDAIGMLQWRQEQSAGEQERFKQVLKGSSHKEERVREESRDKGREM